MDLGLVCMKEQNKLFRQKHFTQNSVFLNRYFLFLTKYKCLDVLTFINKQLSCADVFVYILNFKIKQNFSFDTVMVPTDMVMDYFSSIYTNST